MKTHRSILSFWLWSVLLEALQVEGFISAKTTCGAYACSQGRASVPLNINFNASPPPQVQPRFSQSRSSVSSSALKVASVTGGFTVDKTVALASIAATAKLLSSIGIGGWAASTPNLLDSSAVSSLSRLTYSLFQPCFLLCSVAKTVAQATKGSGNLPLHLMPLVALAQIVLGSLIAKLVTALGNFPKEQAQDVTICLSFANSGPLPLIFSETLPFAPDVKGDVVACISFYLLMWSPLFWSFGRVILGTYGNKDDHNKAGIIPSIISALINLLSPPVVGCIIGVLVGWQPFLRDTFLYGIGSPLFDACKTLGTAYVPAAVLILAGSLFAQKGGGDKTTEEKRAAEEADISGKAMLSILFSRFLLSPLCALALVQLFGNLNLLKTARSKAILSFVILMEGCMPPAQNSVIMLQLEGMKKRAQVMAKTLTVLYSLAVVPVTLLLSACLAFSGILDLR